MPITLSRETELFIEQRQKAGGYASPDELIVSALQDYEKPLSITQEDRDRAVQKIEEGFAQIDRGETVDGDEAVARVLARIRREPQ